MILKNADLNGIIQDIITENGKISFIGKTNDAGIDLKGAKVYPGLIDIHCHGSLGYDTMDGDKLEQMSMYEAENGITSWYPTTMTTPYEAIKSVTDCDIEKIKGANVLGFHLEGPYIAEKYKGAQNPDYIAKPDIKEFKSYRNAKLITLAPEVEGSLEFIKNCEAVVCIGHTDATYDEAVSAFQSGAKCLTHTFNAMPPLHHREPGVIGAAITEGGYAQVISDGLHIHKAAVIALYRMFTSDKMILISDTIRAAGMPDGEYELGGQQMNVKNGVARISDGALAGSTTNLFKCVKKAIEFGIEPDEAFKMASLTPARLMGIDDIKGKIEVGYDSDIIAVDDTYNLVLSMVGEQIYMNNL